MSRTDYERSEGRREGGRERKVLGRERRVGEREGGKDLLDLAAGIDRPHEDERFDTPPRAPRAAITRGTTTQL